MKDFVRFAQPFRRFPEHRNLSAFTPSKFRFFCRKRLLYRGYNFDFLAFSFDNPHKKE